MPFDDVDFDYRRLLLDEIHHLNERDQALLWNTALAFAASVFFWVTLALIHLQWWWPNAGPVPEVFSWIFAISGGFSFVKAISFLNRREAVAEGISAARFQLHKLQTA